MSNLLDSASIVLTPTAYDNGKMLSVKPNTDLFGSELVTNGDFATDSDWSKGAGWSISGGNLLSTNSAQYVSANQSVIGITLGKTYKTTINVNSISGGYIVKFGSNGSVYSLSLGLNTINAIWDGTNNGLAIYNNTSSSGTITIDNVSVKEDLSGDFNFSRNSAATRVNAQGLVENVQILSGDLVSNGDFSQEGVQEVSNGSFSQEGAELITNGDFTTDSNWTKGNGTTISGGNANFVNADGVSLYQNIGTQSGFVKVTFNITDYTSGTLNVYSGGNESVGSINVSANALGTYTAYVDRSGGNSNIIFGSSNLSNFTGSIDNVSVKEVGQDWTLGTGWSIGEDKVVHSGTQSLIGQSNILTIGKTYKITFDLSGADGSNYARLLTSQYPNGGNYTSDGTISVYTITNIDDLYIYGVGDISITNISVKEVGQDWTLGTGWSIGEDKVIATSVSNQFVTQSFAFTSGKRYRASFSVTGTSSLPNNTSLRLPYDGWGSSIAYVNQNSDGVYSNEFVSGGSSILYLGGGSFTGTITNISVIEITDDTNLPRINYEGFSYQDVLGSEEVVNGSFDSDTNWNNFGTPLVSQQSSVRYYSSPFSWYIKGNAFRQGIFSPNNFTLTNGKTYKVSLWVYAENGTEIQCGLTNTNQSVFATRAITQSQWTNINYLATANATSNSYISILTSNSTFEFYVDNVSIKEVTGQEVVPDSGCGSWLLEPQSTNIQRYSTTLSTNWLVTGTGVVTYNNAISPDGTNNATYFSAPASSSKGLYNQLSLSTSTYTASVWAKSKGLGNDKFQLGNGSGTGIGGVGEFTATSEWQRFEKTGTTVSGSRPVGVFQPIDSSAMDILFWGYQYEQQSYATSYIPTNGATSTRLQDIANNSGNATLINSTEGVLYAEIAALADDLTFRQISLSDGTNQNRVVIRYRTSSNRINFLLSAGGSTILNQTPPVSDITDMHKVAISYKSGDIRLYIDGVKLAPSSQSSSPFTISGLDDLSFNGAANVDSFYGKTKAVVVYKEALTDEQLTCLTTI